MSLVLPSTVEEINYMQNTLDFQSPPPMYVKDNSKGFENIDAPQFKREVSLPNGVPYWNVQDYGPYLNFEEDLLSNNLEAINYQVVPGDEQRERSESFSSVSSSTMEDKSAAYHSMGVKTFNTVRMDSGSTCITADHSYVNQSVLESEETFQNLNSYFTQGPEMHTTDTTSSISSINSPLNDTTLDYSSMLSNISTISNNSEDSFSEKSVSIKRSATASPDELFMMGSKRICNSPDNRYLEVRKKNNIASKNCRKTRKEKQKEMEMKVAELLKEREDLHNKILYHERVISVYKKHIESILKPRQLSQTSLSNLLS